MRGIIMIALVFSLLAGTSCYLSYRLYQGLAAFLTGVKFWPVLVAVCILMLLLGLGFGRALMPFSVELKHVLGLIGGYCMGTFIYLLMFTVAADLLLLLPRILKLSFTAHRLFNSFVMLGVLLLTLGTCIYGYAHVKQIDHVSYEIQLRDRKDISDLNVVMISDLHLGAVGSEKRLQAVVDEINACRPDIVCIAGDFFDTDIASIQDPEAAIRTIRSIEATYGVYACLGNHDGGKTFDRMVDFLQQADIRLLDDSYTVIDDKLVLAGRLDASAIGGYGDRKRLPFSEVFERTDPSMPVIVLDHNPAHIDEYTTQADLILCGHTHKGQLFPANLLTKLIYTVDYGYYRKDAQSPQVVVSSGVGAWGFPMRVGTNCEIVTLHFSAGE